MGVNIGLRDFDLYQLLVVKTDEFRDELLLQRSLGLLTDLDRFEDKGKMQDENLSYYYFSHAPGTIDIVNSVKREQRRR